MITPANDRPKKAGIIKKLTKHGNSLALVIERPVLDLLGIDENTPVRISTDGRHISIERATDDSGETREARFEAALKDTNDKYGPILKRLAE